MKLFGPLSHPMEQSLMAMIQIWLRENLAWYECTAFESTDASNPYTKENLKKMVETQILAELKNHIVYEEQVQNGKFYLQGKVWIPRRTPSETMGPLQR